MTATPHPLADSATAPAAIRRMPADPRGVLLPAQAGIHLALATQGTMDARPGMTGARHH